MFFPFVLLLLTCLANSSHSEVGLKSTFASDIWCSIYRQVSENGQPLGKQANQQPQSVPNTESRQRRLRRDLNDLKDSNDIFDDSSAMRPLELEIDGVPQPLLFFLQKMCKLQGTKPLRVKTPRLGRTLEFETDDDRMRLPFGARLNKKNVPFKPRLGKRTCICDGN